VPNSIRIPNNQCFELVPTKAGGLYRRAADIVNTGSDPLDATAADISFDVLSTLAAAPVAGDFVVIGNQNTNDVYDTSGAVKTRGTVSTWTVPPAPGGASVGVGRITLDVATQFPSGYDGGRFQIVDKNESSVFYVCSGAGEASGNGTGQLLRVVRGFNATYPAACPAGGALLAGNVASCSFVYDPAHGATQQSGFVWMRIELLSGGERMALTYGAHVSNVP
jgi:MSHA biogenesis protein MshO